MLQTIHDTYIDSIGELPVQISKHIPEGYAVLDTAIGDLNMDGINDVLLAICHKGEDTLSDFANGHEEKRPLLLLLGQADQSYSLARRNDNVVMCIDCSGVMVRSDPFTGLKIRNGYFSVEHGVAEGPQHWNRVTTFRYDKEKKEWYLHKDGGASYTLSDDPNSEDGMKKVHEDLKTTKDFGEITFEKFKPLD